MKWSAIARLNVWVNVWIENEKIACNVLIKKLISEIFDNKMQNEENFELNCWELKKNCGRSEDNNNKFNQLNWMLYWLSFKNFSLALNKSYVSNAIIY